MTALILCTYNRPQYLKQCLDSLMALTEWPELLIIVDDASTDSETLELLGSFNPPCKTIRCGKNANKGIKDSLLEGYTLAWSYNADRVINLDGDAIVKPDFITRLKKLHVEHPQHIVSGFNCNNPKNPVEYEGEDYVMRIHANGINMCIDRDTYRKWVEPGLKSQGNWDFNSTPSNRVVITKPSVVQHIGLDSSMGHVGADVACDFYGLELPNVTLFGIDAHDPAGIKRAADICTSNIKFGDVKIITEHEYFRGREGYSKFCIKDMAKFVDTSHVLIIHGDGFVQDHKAWDSEWLAFDYIGGTWWYKDNMNNGNGGFSLRSKKLLDILAKLDIEGVDVHPEDNWICRQIRPWLEKEYGIKFAPEEVCNRFSIEAYSTPAPDNVYSGQFGFHGYSVKGLPIQPAAKLPVTVQRKLNRTVPTYRR